MGKSRTRSGRKLLMVNSTTDSPMSVVSFVKKIEITGADPGDCIAVHVKDDTRVSNQDPYIFKGSGRFDVNIPRGRVQIKRLRGSNPITVYAVS